MKLISEWHEEVECLVKLEGWKKSSLKNE
jgi:hypothetical protein